MLLTKNLIEGAKPEYVEMLKEVNIPDFYKCIAEFSGLSMDRIDDEQVKEYLLTWAKNKYEFWKLLGNKLRLDQPFTYKKMRDNIRQELDDLEMDYPAYSLWLDCFRRATKNEVEWRELDWSTRDKLNKLFPQNKFDGCSLTGFFKRMLNAPDELVTKLAHIFENDEIKATHTISIDPVDMMLASENPYNWESCYRLETDNCSSHADGCMAAVLDTKSLITYVWNHEGKLKIYNEYDFKCVRYKRMRQWVALSEKMTTIHFNTIYPGKDYDDELEKHFRDMVESVVANYLGIRNMWRQVDRESNVSTTRYYDYGYGEFRRAYMWYQSDSTPESIKVYDEEINCACGCGTAICGSDEGKEYLGEGFTCTGFSEGHWCEYIEDYCSDGDCTEECCSCCETWMENHPTCSLDPDIECEDVDWDEARHGVMEANHSHCHSCPHWERCHAEEEFDDDDDVIAEDCDDLD